MGNRYRHTLLTIVAVISSLGLAPGTGQGAISVSQSIDRTEMAFEDTADFQVVVSWSGPAHAYRFEKAFRVQSDRLKVARFSSSVRSTGTGPDELTTKIFEYRLAPILSGVATIEPLVIEYVAWPDSLVGELVTDPVTVAIAEPVPAELREEGGISGGWIALIAVLVIGAGVGLYAVFKPKVAGEVVKSPALSFLEELEQVRKDSGMDLKKFQTGLYRCLEGYIRVRYGIDLSGCPASAAATELEKVEPSGSVRDTLSDWLTRAEREKFSPLAAAPGEVPRLEAEVRSFFEKLK